ncbi:MAG: PAS domain S-box protein [bacterium]
MKQKTPSGSESDLTELRKHAEDVIDPNIVEVVNLSIAETAHIIHELRIHQVELEMQNHELRNTQSALQEAKDEYTDLYDYAPVGYVTINEKGTILKANLTITRILDVERVFLTGRFFYEFVTQDGQDRYYFFIKRLLAGEKDPSVELKLKKSDGSELWACLDSTPINKTGRGHKLFRLSVTDITRHKQAEEKLREQDKRLHFHTEISPLAVLEWDANFIISRWTGEAERIFGWRAEETIGRHMMDIKLIYEDDIPKVEETLAKLTSGKMPNVIASNRNYTRDGQVIHCTWYNSVLVDDQNRMVSIMSQALDVTSHIAAEEKIKASLMEKETLLQEIHHRVKNNMSVVSSLLSLQMANVADTKAKVALQESENRIHTMSMIHDTLYRSDDLSSINVQMYLSDLCDAILRGYSVNQHECLEIEAGNIVLTAKQASPLGLIVNELITNSLKYAFPGNKAGQIRLRLTESNQGQVDMHYSDDGIGMPADFEWHNTKTLGLSLVKMLAENQLKGTIALIKGEGTCFELSFKIMADK